MAIFDEKKKCLLCEPSRVKFVWLLLKLAVFNYISMPIVKCMAKEETKTRRRMKMK